MKTIVQYLCVLTLLWMGTSTAYAGEMSVIVNNSNAVTTVSVAEAKEYFLQNRTWALGRRVRPTDNQGNEDMRNAFLLKVLNFSAIEAERYWLEQQYSQATKPPVTLYSDEEVIRHVIRHKGGLGIIDSSAVSENVKTILTISY